MKNLGGNHMKYRSPGLYNAQALWHSNQPSMTNKKRILLVDNDPLATRMARLMIEKIDVFEVQEVNDPRQAVCVACAFRPDLILLDVEMPEMDGGDVAAQIRTTKELAGTHLIFLTSLMTETETGEPRFSGGCRVLAKPVTMSKLIDCVVDQLKFLSAATRSHPSLDV